jgi:mannose-6-phosphate isomerase-like protein (cupin superfamily)
MFFSKRKNSLQTADIYEEKRPWGAFRRFTLNQKATVKIITVNPNQELSLQQHAHRDEEWRILSGSGFVVVGDTKTEVRPGQEFFVTRGMKHRVAGGPEGLTFLEIAFGDFDEKDIVRLEDNYGRA